MYPIGLYLSSCFNEEDKVHGVPRPHTDSTFTSMACVRSRKLFWPCLRKMNHTTIKKRLHYRNFTNHDAAYVQGYMDNTYLNYTIHFMQTSLSMHYHDYPSTGDDYYMMVVPNIIILNNTNKMECVTVNITDDNIVEGTERFYVQFSGSVNNHIMIVGNDTVPVYIVDNEGKYSHLLMPCFFAHVLL